VTPVISIVDRKKEMEGRGSRVKGRGVRAVENSKPTVLDCYGNQFELWNGYGDDRSSKHFDSVICFISGFHHLIS